MKNLKIRNKMVALLLGFGIFSLASTFNTQTVTAKENVSYTTENDDEKDYSLYQKYSREDINEEFAETNTFYAVDVNKTPIDTNYTSYQYQGDLTMATLEDVFYNRIATNYKDVEAGNYINEDRIYKDAYKDCKLVSYNDNVNKIVNKDGVVLGYTPKIKILEYR